MTVNRRELLKGSLVRCHIASLVVQCLPRNLESTRAAIEALDGAEVPEFDECGKLVVAVDPSELALLDAVERTAFQQMVYAALTQ